MDFWQETIEDTNGWEWALVLSGHCGTWPHTAATHDLKCPSVLLLTNIFPLTMDWAVTTPISNEPQLPAGRLLPIQAGPYLRKEPIPPKPMTQQESSVADL